MELLSELVRGSNLTRRKIMMNSQTITKTETRWLHVIGSFITSEKNSSELVHGEERRLVTFQGEKRWKWRNRKHDPSALYIGIIQLAAGIYAHSRHFTRRLSRHIFY